MSNTMSVVATDNVEAAAGGECSVCFEVAEVLYRCEHCAHGACAGCLTTVIGDTFIWTGCDNCNPPKRPLEEKIEVEEPTL